eukprot:360224-Chlamydomonas_euryale.AAC.5
MCSTAPVPLGLRGPLIATEVVQWVQRHCGCEAEQEEAPPHLQRQRAGPLHASAGVALAWQSRQLQRRRQRRRRLRGLCADGGFGGASAPAARAHW